MGEYDAIFGGQSDFDEIIQDSTILLDYAKAQLLLDEASVDANISPRN